LFLDERENDGVGNELPAIHELLSFEPQGGPGFHRRAQDVPGRDLRKPEPLGENLTLWVHARAWCAKQKDEHGSIHVLPTTAELDAPFLHEAVVVAQEEVLLHLLDG